MVQFREDLGLDQGGLSKASLSLQEIFVAHLHVLPLTCVEILDAKSIDIGLDVDVALNGVGQRNGVFVFFAQLQENGVELTLHLFGNLLALLYKFVDFIPKLLRFLLFQGFFEIELSVHAMLMRNRGRIFTEGTCISRQVLGFSLLRRLHQMISDQLISNIEFQKHLIENLRLRAVT